MFFFLFIQSILSGGGRTTREIIYKDNPLLVAELKRTKEEMRRSSIQAREDLCAARSGMQALKCQFDDEQRKARDLEFKMAQLQDAIQAQEREKEMLKKYPPTSFQLTSFWKDKRKYHVGIVGGAGTGKSTFINTLMGKKKNDQGAARVSHVSECTTRAKPYEIFYKMNRLTDFRGQEFLSTTMPYIVKEEDSDFSVVYWDLPGGGTPSFPWETYLRDMGIKYFDFIVLLTATRFTEGDLLLYKEMKNENVKHAMVRTKIDNVKYTCKMEGDDFQTELREIGKDFKIHQGISERVFCVSAFLDNMHKYDFPDLLQAMVQSQI